MILWLIFNYDQILIKISMHANIMTTQIFLLNKVWISDRTATWHTFLWSTFVLVSINKLKLIDLFSLITIKTCRSWKLRYTSKTYFFYWWLKIYYTVMIPLSLLALRIILTMPKNKPFCHRKSVEFITLLNQSIANWWNELLSSIKVGISILLWS